LNEPSLAADAPCQSETMSRSIFSLCPSHLCNRIASLASKSITTLEALHTGLDYALRPFIDHSNRNTTDEIARCSSQFRFPEARASNSTAAVAVKTTSTHMPVASDALMVGTLDEAALLIRNLKN
jgi:hypothetical protein